MHTRPRSTRPGALPRPIATVVALLTVLAALSATWFAPAHQGDLAFFLDAYRAMVGSAGLDVYAELPNIQSGPIALLGVGLLDALGPNAFPIAVGFAYVVTILAATRLRGVAERDPLTVAAGGLVLLFWWRAFAFQGHFDDAAVVALAVVAVLAVQRDRRVSAALLLGLCLAIKPWAVFLLPVTIPLDGHWRRRLAMPALSVVVGALAWSPFLLASTDTLDGVRPTVWSAPDSVLRLLSGSASPMPTAVRVLQLLLCLLAAAWVTLRGRVEASIYLGIALRLLLDGGTWSYYTAGLVAGALLVDLTCHRRRVPWVAVTTSLLLPKSTWIDVPELRASMRAAACLGAFAVVAWVVRRPGAAPATGPQPTRSDAAEVPATAAEFV